MQNWWQLDGTDDGLGVVQKTMRNTTKMGETPQFKLRLGLGHCGVLEASVQDREANEEVAFKRNGLCRCSFGRPTRSYNSGGDRVFEVEYADENPDSIRE